MVPLATLASQAEGYSSFEKNNVRLDRKPIERGERWNGFFKVSSATAENGHGVSSALWMSPRRVAGGFIELHFPQVQIPADAVLRAELGFLESAKRSPDGVDYVVEVGYYVGADGRAARVAYGHKNYTGSLESLAIDLSPIAQAADGRRVTIRLHVGAGPNSDNDTLLWINPRIESGEGDAYRFELHLDSFAINAKNESRDEPSVFLRGAYFSARHFDVDKLADAEPTLIRPGRFNPGKDIPANQRIHPFEWAPVRPSARLLDSKDANDLNRLCIAVLFTERDDSNRQERDRGEQLADELLRLHLRDELLRIILRDTRNLSRKLPRNSFESWPSIFDVRVYEAAWRGYVQTVAVGGDNDDFVGSARFAAPLIDLLTANPNGTFVQFVHQNVGKGRYQIR